MKDYNFTAIVMSSEFEQMDQRLMVEVIRRRHQPTNKMPANEQEEEVIGVIFIYFEISRRISHMAG